MPGNVSVHRQALTLNVTTGSINANRFHVNVVIDKAKDSKDRKLLCILVTMHKRYSLSRCDRIRKMYHQTIIQMFS